MENSILGNQLVVMSRADLDALLERMASNLAASKVEECVSNDVRPGVCDEERFLTREEAAKMLHVDYSTLWRWNKLSILCPNKVGPRRVMYKYSDVLKKLNGEGQQEGQQSTATSSKVQFFNCRYYHFRDFLNEADTHRSRNKTILSAELQEMIEQLTNGFESGKMIEILSVL